MNLQFKSPKRAGEILDYTFRLSKYRFKDFFLIFLILVGPIHLIQALIQLFSGKSFFREVGTGATWYEQMFTSFNENADVTAFHYGTEIGLFFIGLISLALFPVAEASILFAVNHIRNNEEYKVSSVIKQAFKRFWPIIGSSLLFALIVFGLFIVPVFIVSIGGVMGVAVDPVVGISVAVVLFLICLVGIGYLLTRWSFYFGAVVLEGTAPGLTRSWRLTRGRTWILMGLYIVFWFIIAAITMAVELSFSAILGNSVLLSLIVSLVTMFTTMLFSVGYAVMYFDLRIRHDADDLKELIEEYDDDDNEEK